MSYKETKNEEWQKVIEANAYLKAEDSLKERVELKEVLEGSKTAVSMSPAEIAKTMTVFAQKIKEAVPFLEPKAKAKGIIVTDEDLVMIAAGSGKGKSTLTANIALSYSTQTKPVLLISTEEGSREVWRRLACMHLGLNLNSINAGDLPANFESLVTSAVEYLSQRIHVRTNDLLAKGSYHQIEVMENTLNQAIGNYSAVIIDYYQDISESLRFPNKEPHDVQAKFCYFIDGIRTTIGCPIFAMAQSKPLRKGADRYDLQEGRQLGRKLLYTKSTLVIEIQKVANSSNAGKVEQILNLAEETGVDTIDMATVFYIQKSRFQSESNNAASLYTFNKGRYDFIRSLSQKNVTELLD